MSIDLLTTFMLVGAGFVAGTINSIAGGGSLLTLPLLIFIGLPATVANGTNRVAIKPSQPEPGNVASPMAAVSLCGCLLAQTT